jgi:hypothetical protein
MKIKINFVDFWEGFDKTNNYFFNLLKEEFDVEISKDPEYLFFSVFGPESVKYNCKKIFYTGENIRPPLWCCQYSFSFDYINDPRNYRLPHYLIYEGYYDLTKTKIIDERLTKRKFCNFIFSNHKCNIRNTFFEKLSKYKKVDSGGKWMNNIGYIVSGGRTKNNIEQAIKEKREFQSQYKFSIAFENQLYLGYTTEKILDPMTVNSIPIYWGNPKICDEFNSKSFISFTDYKNMDQMIEHIIELDKDDDKYMNLLNQTWFKNNEIPENNKLCNIKNFLYSIFRR